MGSSEGAVGHVLLSRRGTIQASPSSCTAGGCCTAGCEGDPPGITGCWLSKGPGPSTCLNLTLQIVKINFVVAIKGKVQPETGTQHGKTQLHQLTFKNLPAKGSRSF